MNLAIVIAVLSLGQVYNQLVSHEGITFLANGTKQANGSVVVDWTDPYNIK